MTTQQERTIRLYRCDLASFTQVRGLSGVNESWERAVASAEQALSRFEDTYADNIPALGAPDLDLLSAGRILDAASLPASGIDESQRRMLALDSALAFAMAGNFPSATAKIDQLLLQSALSPQVREFLVDYASACAIMAPNLIPRILSAFHDSIDDPNRRLIVNLRQFLFGGSDGEFENAESSWESILNASINNPHVASVLVGCRVVLFQIRHLNTRRIFETFDEALPTGFVENIVPNGRSLLLPPQWDVLNSLLFRQQKSNFLITTPTNTGKTFLGQVACAFALGRHPGIAIYVAPYQALAHQIYRSFRELFPPSVRIYLAVGGYALELPAVVDSGQTVIVCTPERLDSLLRARPELAGSVRCVIADEAHLLEQNQRGGVIEGLLTRLKMRQERGSKFTIGLLSAVISDPERLQQWLDIPQDLWIRKDWRPTARRLAIWGGQGQLKYYASADPIHRNLAGPEESIAIQELPWPEQIDSTEFIGLINKNAPSASRNISLLVKILLGRKDGPILCICMSRSSTRVLAHILTGQLSDEPLGDVTARLISLIIKRWPELKVLANALHKRVAYHNASLPSQIKELIVEAVDNGELKVVVATTTLAEGIDLPFRYTILYEWLQGAGFDDPIPISALLFRNISGRSGRASRHTEGDTIIYENPLGIGQGVSHHRISEYLRTTFVDPRALPVKSSLSDWKYEQDSEHNRAVLSSQFQATVAEFPDQDDLVSVFNSHLYAFHSDNASQVSRILSEVLEVESDLENDEQGLAIAKKGSPLQLTEFGRATVLTGLSAYACRTTLNVVNDLGRRFDRPSAGFVSELIINVAAIPELAKTDIRRMIRPRSRFVVKQSDGESIIEQWLASRDPLDIFLELQSGRKSTVSPSLAKWVEGWDQPTEWDRRFDQFSRYLDAIVVRILPWLCRSIGLLAPFVEPAWLKTQDWGFVANKLEMGVDTHWAIVALKDEGALSRTLLGPAGRAAESLGYSHIVGRLFPEQIPSELWIESLCDSLRTGTYGKVSDEEVTELRDWLSERATEA